MTNRGEKGNLVKDIAESLLRGISQEDREMLVANREKWEKGLIQIPPDLQADLRERWEKHEQEISELMKRLRDLLG